MKKARTAKARHEPGMGRASNPPAKTVARPQHGKAALEIPSILLEGDEPPAPDVGGPGRRYALGPAAPVEHFEATELPEAYGTHRLILAARDPHWLYAHWDLTREQQKKYNDRSSHGHLILRVYADALGGKLAAQVHVHPESRSWFVHVGRGGSRYQAELGYHQHDGHWKAVCASNATLTPPDFVAAGGAVEFATIPVDVPFERLRQIVKTHARECGPLADAIERLRESGHPELPDAAAFASGEWTAEQQAALAAALSMDEVRRVWIGSLELTEFVRRLMPGEEGPTSAAEITSPVGGLGSVSSPFGGGERPKDFWFNINAELIIYGATEPDASVTIGGRAIKLRPDGSFSYRFALPDGEYELPLVAVSADQTDGRAAGLRFSRATENRGDVGAHPQDPTLKPPASENV